MHINQISNHQTELTLNNGIKVLFSYSTPVASWENGQFYKTAKSWSKTTSRHINAWSHCAETKPQEYFDNLTAGV